MNRCYTCYGSLRFADQEKPHDVKGDVTDVTDVTANERGCTYRARPSARRGRGAPDRHLPFNCRNIRNIRNIARRRRGICPPSAVTRCNIRNITADIVKSTTGTDMEATL